MRDSHVLLLVLFRPFPSAGCMIGFSVLVHFDFFKPLGRRSTSHHVSGQATILGHCFFFVYGLFFSDMELEIPWKSKGTTDTGKRAGSAKRQETAQGATREKRMAFVWGNTTATRPTKPTRGKRVEERDRNFWQGRDSELGGNSICSMEPVKTCKGLLLLMF
ncbi:hypothetical protein BDP55DRAFT_210119 [Colletotrichum godetiae]|uniref:Uncharacterized protein n=1 Tax=Colletotrichum godetiae TaxID=1209918 RepID=A0AAJ0AY20_9PEZI|nr:uncharacterized protein BDP55DRAFT_210119 [Colletotrichum godetiae]KAK1699881.1 hypothetical protein BDP55DRAFT_210119 [Colletotrichum godetiae]